MRLTVETEQEVDGRWIAEIPEVPGALAYGISRQEAVAKAYAIALRSLTDEIERSAEQPPTSISFAERVVA